MVKLVTLFLIGMLILGMIGKLRMPKLPRRKGRRSVTDARKCAKCGTYIIGEGPCPCEKRR